MMTASLLWFSLFVGLLGAMYYKRQTLGIYCFEIANYATDCYLDWKYRNYKVTKLEIPEKKCYLKRIKIISERKEVTIELRCGEALPEELGEGFNDFDKHKMVVHCDEIRRKYAADLGTAIYLCQQYGHEEHILPCEAKRVTLPVYTNESIEVSFAPIYDWGDVCRLPARQATHSSSHDPPSDEKETMHPKLLSYAGPKGNFYTDTDHHVRPEHILADIGNGVYDYCSHIKLSYFGTEYTFNLGERINIPSI